MVRSPQLQKTTLIACVIWMACVVYASRFMYRGWIPHDEGTIGQAAERVLAGQLPHRDFDDTYTGGLTYLNAAAMKAFGVNLKAPRLMLLLFFAGFLAASYGVARRVSSPGIALAALPLITVWSLPNYFAALPSWYNLFFATFGVRALLAFLDTRRRGWLVLAGFCGGCSLLFKIAGVFYLAAGVLFLAFAEHTTSIRRAGQPPSRFWVVLAMPAVAAVLVIGNLIVQRTVAFALLQLFVPAIIVCVYLPWREWAEGSGRIGDRARRLLFAAWPFLTGAAIPIVVYVLFYWQRHALGDLIRGMLILPQRRLIDPAEATMIPPHFWLALIPVLPFAWIILDGRRRPMSQEQFLTVLSVGVFAALLCTSTYILIYRSVWAIVRHLTLLVTVTGVVSLIALSKSDDRGSQRQQAVFLLVAMSALMSLITFPYAAPIYFLYVAPMSILAVVSIIGSKRWIPRGLFLSAAAFWVLFGVLFVNSSYEWALGAAPLPYRADAVLEMERGGLRVPSQDKATYEGVVRLLRDHVSSGTIYAGPDCPEVYFLAGRSNPTRAMFDFLSPVAENRAWMARLLEDAPIQAAVINLKPQFSAALDPGAVAELEKRFPRSERVGQFVVRFR